MIKNYFYTTDANYPEHKLLLYCLRPNMDAQTVERIKSLLEMEIDWDYLRKISLDYGLLPLLYNRLKEICPEAIPEEVSLRFKAEYYASVGYNMTLIHELLKILNILTSQNVPVVPYKGPVLFPLAYGNLPLRQVADLDLLVQKSDREKVITILKKEGYEITEIFDWELTLASSDGRHLIDLHWRIMPPHLGCPFVFRELQERLTGVSFGNKKVSTLSLEDFVILLCINGTKDYWKQLKTVCDLAHLISSHSGIDWQLILYRAQKRGFKRQVLLGCMLTKELFGTDFPDLVLKQIALDRELSFLYEEVAEKFFGATSVIYTQATITFFCIKTRERLRDKALTFWGLMLVSGWLKAEPKDIRDRQVLSLIYYLMKPIRAVLLERKKHLVNLYVEKS